MAKRKRTIKTGGRTTPPAAVALRELRLGTGLTQVAVAARMGVTQRRVSTVESTPVPALEVRTLMAFVAALGGSLSVVAELEAAGDGPARRAVLQISRP